MVRPAESLAAFQFRKVGEEGSLGIDDVTMEAMKGVGVGGEAGAEVGAPFGFVRDAGAVVDEVGGEEAVAAQEPVVFNEDVDEEAFDDAEGMAQALRSVLERPDLAHAMSQRARRVGRSLLWPQVGQRLRGLLEELTEMVKR